MNSTEPATLGAKVRELRTAQSLSQQEVASRAGIAIRTLSNIENGHSSRPWPRVSSALAAALGVSVEDLRGGVMRYRNTLLADARQFPPLTEGWHLHDPLTPEQLADWCGGQLLHTPAGRPYIVVSGGTARPGDWIAPDEVGGDFRVIKREDFELSHEPKPVEDGYDEFGSA